MRALGLWPVAVLVLLIIAAWIRYRRRKGTPAYLVDDPR